MTLRKERNSNKIFEPVNYLVFRPRHPTKKHPQPPEWSIILFFFFNQKQTNVLIDNKNIGRMRGPPHEVQT